MEAPVTYYAATDQDLEKAGAAGAEAVSDELADHVEDIRLLGRMKIGLITVDDICRLFGVEERTVHNWPLRPADTPTQRNYYQVSKIAD